MALASNILTSVNPAAATPGAERARKHDSKRMQQDFDGLLASLQVQMFAMAKPLQPTPVGRVSLMPGSALSVSREAVLAQEGGDQAKAFDVVTSLIDEIVSEAMASKQPMGVDVNLGPYGDVSVKMWPRRKQLDIRLHSGVELGRRLLQPDLLKDLERHGLKTIKLHSRHSGKITLSLKSRALAGVTSEARQMGALKKIVAEFVQEVKNKPGAKIAYFMSHRSLGDLLIRQSNDGTAIEIGVSNRKTKALLLKHMETFQAVSSQRVTPVDMDKLVKTDLSFEMERTQSSEAGARPLVTISPQAGAGDERLSALLDKLRASGLDTDTLIISKPSAPVRRDVQEFSALRQQRIIRNAPDRIDRAVNKLLAKAESVPALRKDLPAIRAELTRVASQLKATPRGGKRVSVKVRTENPQVLKWLQKEAQPVLKQIESNNEQTERLQPVEPRVKTTHAAHREPSSDSTPFSEAKEHTMLSAQAKTVQGEGDALQGSFKQVLVHAPGSVRQIHPLNAAKSGSPPVLNASQMMETIQQISDMAKMQGTISGQKIGVQMDVKELGRIMVDATKNSDKVDLHIRVDTPEARRFMETQLKPLVEQMAKDGVDIGKLDVSVRDNRPEDGQQQPQAQSRALWREEHGFGPEQQRADVKPALLSGQLRHKQTASQTVEIWA